MLAEILHWVFDLCPLHIGLRGYLRKQALASSASQSGGRPAGSSSVGLEPNKVSRHLTHFYTLNTPKLTKRENT